MKLDGASDALDLLRDLGAPARLVRHVELVGEAADVLLAAFVELGVPIDASVVRAGVVLHDAGKAIHQDELARPGSEHEPTGEKMLLERGVPAALARVCRSHAQWDL